RLREDKGFNASAPGWNFKSYVLGAIISAVIFRRTLSPAISIRGEIDAGSPDFRYEDMSDAEAEQAREGLVQEKGFFILPSELFCNVRAKAASDENLNETLETVFRHLRNPQRAAPPRGSLQGCSMITMSTAISWVRLLPSAMRSS
ncbi:MAG: hypothetical protein ACLVJH_00540, partial [Faecalibacterium prausnitzii]